MKRFIAACSIAVGLTGLFSACAGSGPAPTPVPPSLPRALGIAYEHTPEGVRPLAGLEFDMYGSMQSPWDFGTLETLERVVSGENGSYTLSEPFIDLLYIDVPEDGRFHAPCLPDVNSPGGTTMDVHVVSDAVLSSTGTPASVPVTDLRLSGKVTARTNSGGNPVRGAAVRLTTQIDGAPKSATLSDASGNFLLCANVPGVRRGDTLWLRIDKIGYRPASRSISIGEVDSVSLELVRE